MNPVIGAVRLEKMDEELRALFAGNLGVKARSLEKALRRAGRRLPKKQRANGQMIVAAMERAAHPLLQAQCDEAALERGFAELKQHLEGIDRTQSRITCVIRWGSCLAFNLLALVAALIVLLRLRGFV